MPVKVTVCVGSSCHIRGSRAVLKRFAEIVQADDLQEEVALGGAFCMERCGECVNWKFDDEQISNANLADAEATLRRRLAEGDQDDIIL